MAMMVEGRKFFCEVLQQEALKSKIREVVLPSAETIKSDAVIEARCRRSARTGHHPCHTARMGHVDNPLAVPEPRLRVRGIDRLRACGVSAAPYITAGNTNAPATMIADRCADMLLGEA